MIRWKKNDGLTLVELMVSITIGSLIMLAASTVLLLGFRINHQTTESVTRQYTARTVITLLENLASEGGISQVHSELDGSWKAYGKDGSKVVLSYSSKDQQIVTGAGDAATPILEEIVASYLILRGNVLIISIEDFENAYTSSVYCRTAPNKTGENFENNDENNDDNNGDDPPDALIPDKKMAFLELLKSQLGNTGGIIHSHKAITAGEDTIVESSSECICSDNVFFSEWFIGGYSEAAKAKGWSSDTPWCACFVSWGLGHIKDLNNPNTEKNPNTEDDQDDTYVWFANVDDFMEFFPKDKATLWRNARETPEIGDLIFFNLISDDKLNPSHMGAVLDVEQRDDGTYVITIEGNSADMVAVREYPIGDPRIIGYGNPWAAQTGTNDQGS